MKKLKYILLLAAWLCFLYAGASLYASKTSLRSSERDYQDEWCHRYGGRAEVVLNDRTRADCLTAKYAIEFDFAKKWAEAPFQALHYARLTNKLPGVVLICEKSSDFKKLARLKENLDFYKIAIRVWSINCE